MLGEVLGSVAGLCLRGLGFRAQAVQGLGYFPKPYRESTVRQLEDTALAQQKGGLPSADALELSLQTCILDEIILYRSFFIKIFCQAGYRRPKPQNPKP